MLRPVRVSGFRLGCLESGAPSRSPPLRVGWLCFRREPLGYRLKFTGCLRTLLRSCQLAAGLVRSIGTKLREWDEPFHAFSVSHEEPVAHDDLSRLHDLALLLLVRGIPRKLRTRRCWSNRARSFVGFCQCFHRFLVYRHAHRREERAERADVLPCRFTRRGARARRSPGVPASAAPAAVRCCG